MKTLARCCLITLRFDSDLNQSMALCACCSVESFTQVIAAAFAHPVFSRFDEAAKIQRIAQSLERTLLEEAGVATKSTRSTEEAFVILGQEAPVVSQWVDLELAGKINARKTRVLEANLRDWMQLLFANSHCCLPSARPIPIGNAADLGALRAGWRAEAEARGFSTQNVAALLTPTPELADPGSDGFPSGAKSRRKK